MIQGDLKGNNNNQIGITIYWPISLELFQTSVDLIYLTSLDQKHKISQKFSFREKCVLVFETHFCMRTSWSDSGATTLQKV